jgi:hypothetical protein
VNDRGPAGVGVLHELDRIGSHLPNHRVALVQRQLDFGETAGGNRVIAHLQVGRARAQQYGGTERENQNEAAHGGVP